MITGKTFKAIGGGAGTMRRSKGLIHIMNDLGGLKERRLERWNIGVRPMTMKTDERRRHRRRRIRISTWMRFQGDRAMRGTMTHDLAPEGALFSALSAPDAGAFVLLYLDLNHSRPPLECKGRVCWTRRMSNGLHHFGVRFIDLEEDDRDRLLEAANEQASIRVLAAI